MTSPALILSIHACGLLFALGLGAWVSSRAPGSPEVRRFSAAAERAGLGLCWAHYRRLAAVAGALGLVCTGLLISLSPGVAGLTPGVSAFLFGLAFILGCLATCVSVHFAARLSLRTATGAATACERGLEDAVLLSARGGGAVALLAETLSGLTYFCLLLLAQGLTRGANPGLLYQVAVGHGLGMAVSGLALQRAGTLLAASPRAVDDPAFARDDARNPAALNLLLGRMLGSPVSATADYCLTTSLGNVAMVALLSWLVTPADEAADAAPVSLAWLLLPLLVRAFGTLATGFGVMVTRSSERESVTVALWRGGLTTLVVLIGGGAACALWLSVSGDALRALAALIGVAVATSAAVFSAVHRLTLGRAAAAAAPARLSAALRSALGPLGVLTGLLLLGMAYLPASAAARADQGVWLGLIALASLLALGPFALSAQLSAQTALAAAALLRVTRGEREQTARVQRLATAGRMTAARAALMLGVTGGAAALLGALTLALGPTAEAPGSLRLITLVTCLGPLAVALVVAYLGDSLRSATTTAQALAGEVRGQLPDDSNGAELPEDFSPSYRACLEVAHAALRTSGLRSTAALTLSVGMLAGLLLLLFDASTTRLGLAGFCVLASSAAFVLAWAAEAFALHTEGPASFSGPSGSTGATSSSGLGAAGPGRGTLALEQRRAGPVHALLTTCGASPLAFTKALALASLALAVFLA